MAVIGNSWEYPMRIQRSSQRISPELTELMQMGSFATTWRSKTTHTSYGGSRLPKYRVLVRGRIAILPDADRNARGARIRTHSHNNLQISGRYRGGNDCVYLQHARDESR